MSERLTDDELDAIEEQCDGSGMLVLNSAAQRDVRVMVAELRERRAADLNDMEREALKHARQFVAADLCGEERCQSSACQRNERAIGVLQRLIAAHGGAK